MLRSGRCPESVAADVVHDVLEIVAHCHACGVIHCDLKLENLMLTGEGPTARVKVIDFGSSALTTPGQVSGVLHGPGPPAAS